MTPMVVVIIHHVTKKPMKMLETTVVRPVGRAQTQVPFAHNRRVVTGGPQRAGEQGDTFTKLTPTVLGVRSDDAGNASQFWIAAGE